MLKKLKQKVETKFSVNFVFIAAVFIAAGWFYFGQLKAARATDFPGNSINFKTDIEVTPGQFDNLIRVVKGQSVNFTVDLTVVSAKNASGTDVSQIDLNNDNFALKDSKGQYFVKSIKKFGAGLDVFGHGNTCKTISFAGGGETVLQCDFSKVSNQIPGNIITVGQTYKLNFSLGSTSLTQFNIDPNAQVQTPQSFGVYPYADVDLGSVTGSMVKSMSFENASKQIFVQFFNSQAELQAAAASNTRPPGVPNYGSNTGSGAVNGTNDSPLVTLITNIITAILGFINQFIYFIFYWLIAPIIQAVLSIHVYSDAFVNVIYPGWEIVRNVCNILFIVAIIAMGMATLLRVESYQWRHLLIQLVLAALLINFSLIIAQAILALADTIQSQFLPNNVDVIRSLARDLMIANNATQISQNTFAGNVSYVIQFMFFVSMAIGSFLVFSAIAIFLVIRVVAIWVLLMLSPIAYAANILPATKSAVHKWWDEFIKYAFFTPVIAFFLNMTAVISNAARNSSVLQQASNNTGTSTAFALAPAFAGSNSPNLSNFVLTVLSNILLLVFLIIAIKVADSMGVMGAGALSSIAEKGMKLPFTTAGYLGKKGGKTAMENADSGRVKLANSIAGTKPDSWYGKVARRVGIGILAPGAVHAVKKHERDDKRKENKELLAAHVHDIAQPGHGAAEKFQRRKENEKVKKAQEDYANATENDVVHGLQHAIDEGDIVTFRALMKVATDENYMGGVATHVGGGDIDDVYRKMNTSLDAKKKSGDRPKVEQARKQVDKNESDKGRFQNMSNIPDIDPATGAPVPGTGSRDKKLSSLAIEDLAKVDKGLYMTGSAGARTSTQVLQQIVTAMSSDPDIAKDLIKKMKKSEKDELRRLFGLRSVPGMGARVRARAIGGVNATEANAAKDEFDKYVP